MQSRETQITMVKWTNAGGQTKGADEQSFVYRPPAWRLWRNVKTTYSEEPLLWSSRNAPAKETRMSWLHNLWRRYFCFLQTARPLLGSVTWDQVLCSFLRLVNRRTHKKKCTRAGSDLWCLARITTGYKRVSSVWGKKEFLLVVFNYIDNNRQPFFDFQFLMIWLVGAGGGGCTPYNGLYRVPFSGFRYGRDFISWRLWKVRDICRLGLLKGPKGLTGADRFEVIYSFIKYDVFTAVERDVSCKLAMWKRVSFVSRTQTKGVPFLSEWYIKRKDGWTSGWGLPVESLQIPPGACVTLICCVLIRK